MHYHIDTYTLQEIRARKDRLNQYLILHWEFYSCLADQRARIIEDLKKSLAGKCQPYKFSGWQRVVSYQYATHPLSAKGSILSDLGGRFNIGDIDEIKYPKFPALYLAEDRNTAYLEKYGLEDTYELGSLKAEDIILSKSDSLAIINIKGEISSVIDIDRRDSLDDFVALIKGFKVSPEIIVKSKKYNIPLFKLIQTTDILREALLDPDWRKTGQYFDVPAAPQIFGQIAQAAGIEAILYPSKCTGRKCLAIFPHNFTNSESFVELIGDVPKEVKFKRIDDESWENFI